MVENDSSIVRNFIFLSASLLQHVCGTRAGYIPVFQTVFPLIRYLPALRIPGPAPLSSFLDYSLKLSKPRNELGKKISFLQCSAVPLRNGESLFRLLYKRLFFGSHCSCPRSSGFFCATVRVSLVNENLFLPRPLSQDLGYTGKLCRALILSTRFGEFSSDRHDVACGALGCTGTRAIMTMAEIIIAQSQR